MDGSKRFQQVVKKLISPVPPRPQAQLYNPQQCTELEWMDHYALVFGYKIGYRIGIVVGIVLTMLGFLLSTII